MAFKEVSGKTRYCKYKEQNPGDVLVVGKFVGEIPNKYDDTGKKNDFEFREENGERVVLNYSGHLKYLLDEFAYLNQTVKITYNGMAKANGGKYIGKDCHQFKLEVDDSFIPNISVQPTSTPWAGKKTENPKTATATPSNLDDMGV